MAPVTLSSLLSLASIAVSIVSAQVTGTFPAVPLASEHFQYPNNIPYQADTNTGLIRGTQYGYNRCNSTTEGQSSLCQTMFFNNITDFCLWSPPKPNSTVSDWEGEMVAWCTQPGRGTRLIPDGALQGVQWIKTSAYVQVVGFINQPLIDLNADDYGGEMDPHGADLRGNPLGGLCFSTAFTGQWDQVIEWHNFMGGSSFCFKACDPANPHAADFCQHIFDRIGCAYNVPNNAQNGTFESCLGDLQDYPGVYTSNGVVMTYTQPPESLGPITTMPYTPKVPASSSCTTYSSAELFTALPTISSSGSSSSATGTASGKSSGKSGSSTSSGSPAEKTGSSSDATTIAISGLSFLGVVFSALFLS